MTGVTGSTGTGTTLIVQGYQGITIQLLFYVLVSISMLATFLLLYKKSLLFRIAYVVTAAIELTAMIPDINKILAIILAEGLWTVYLFRSKQVNETCMISSNSFSWRSLLQTATVSRFADRRQQAKTPSKRMVSLFRSAAHSNNRRIGFKCRCGRNALPFSPRSFPRWR